MGELELYREQTQKALVSFFSSITYSEKDFGDPALHRSLQDATIHAFEYSLEVFWKLLKQHLREYSKINVEEVRSPRSVLKLARQAKLINKEEFPLCIKMIEDRNRTSHLYSQAMAEKIYKKCRTYYTLMNTIVTRLYE